MTISATEERPTLSISVEYVDQDGVIWREQGITSFEEFVSFGKQAGLRSTVRRILTLLSLRPSRLDTKTLEDWLQPLESLFQEAVNNGHSTAILLKSTPQSRGRCITQYLYPADSAPIATGLIWLDSPEMIYDIPKHLWNLWTEKQQAAINQMAPVISAHEADSKHSPEQSTERTTVSQRSRLDEAIERYMSLEEKILRPLEERSDSLEAADTTDRASQQMLTLSAKLLRLVRCNGQDEDGSYQSLEAILAAMEEIDQYQQRMDCSAQLPPRPDPPTRTNETEQQPTKTKSPLASSKAPQTSSHTSVQRRDPAPDGPVPPQIRFRGSNEMAATEFRNWAKDSLDHWRALVGGSIQHRAFGEGRVLDVRSASHKVETGLGFELVIDFMEEVEPETIYSITFDNRRVTSIRLPAARGLAVEQQWRSSLPDRAESTRSKVVGDAGRIVQADRKPHGERSQLVQRMEQTRARRMLERREEFDARKDSVAGLTLDDVSELHYIVDIANVPSILDAGILSRNSVRTRRLRFEDFSLPSVQRVRASQETVDGLKIHDYANLYFFAHNITLYTILHHQPVATICILSIDPAVLTMPYTHVSDGNLGSRRTLCWPSPEGLAIINKAALYSWDPFRFQDQRRIQCSEVLVYGGVEPKLIRKLYVATQQAKRDVERLEVNLPVEVNPRLFQF